MTTDERLLLESVRFRHRAAAGRPGFGLAIDRFVLAAGESLALVGPSGSGKTTLLDLATGIRAPQSGRVRAGEIDLTAVGDAARRRWRLRAVGFVFQEFELLEHLTALENVLLPARLAGGGGREDRDRARTLAGRTGIEPLLGRRPARLSHGERQRVAICRALIADPPLLVADEPTGSLDPATAGAITELLLEEVRGRRRALLVVTHDHALLDRFDRVEDVRRFAQPAEAAR